MDYSKQGVKPVKKDHRDYSFHRTFGSTDSFADSYTVEKNLTNPSQQEDGLPMGCTAYTQTELCQDEDGVVYSPLFTYGKTLFMEGSPFGSGCDVRTSLKSTIVYGVQEVGEAPENAINHRRGSYYAIERSTDWFDSIRSAIVTNERSVSVATRWYQAWSNVGPNGIIVSPVSYTVGFSLHNFKISGWTTINGIPYLIAKPWFGKLWGDKGYCYFPREVVNQMMSMPEAGAFTVAPFTSQTILTVQLTLYETIASYLRRIISLLKTP